MSKLIIAIPRGRIIKELKPILKKTSFAPENEMFDDKSRKLTFLSKNKDINFIKVRALTHAHLLHLERLRLELLERM